MDGWTSPNVMSYLGVVVYYTANDKVVVCRWKCIALRREEKRGLKVEYLRQQLRLPASGN